MNRTGMARTNIRTRLALVLTVALGSTVSIAGPAAASPRVPNADWSYIQHWGERYGRSAAQTAAVVAKIERGEQLDSMVAGARPVEVDHRVEGDAKLVVRRFADGSLSVDSVQNASVVLKPGAMRPANYYGCTVTDGTYYTTYRGCTVQHLDDTFHLWFTASWEQYSGGAQIDSASAPHATAHYGSLTAPTLRRVRTYASGSTPAVETEHSYFTGNFNNSSQDLYLSIRVTTSSAWTTDY